MSRSQRKQLLLAEREDLHGFLSSLRPSDWAAPSLCSEWTVLEVAASLGTFGASEGS